MESMVMWIVSVAAGLILFLAAAVLLFIAGRRSAIPKRYDQAAKTGRPIEALYAARGPHAVAHRTLDAPAPCGRLTVDYPAARDGGPYPLVVMANGTGVPASRYRHVFSHLAFWGFVVVGNEDRNARSGASCAASLDAVLALSDDPDSPLHGLVDARRIGVGGHSQGGVGAIRAVTAQANGHLYKALWTASATSSFWGQDGALGASWRYDVSSIRIPYLMVAGTGPADAGSAARFEDAQGQGICPLWSMRENLAALPGEAPALMARRKHADHAQMLYAADGYMTAWFMAHLHGDARAAAAFFGPQAELFANPLWTDAAARP